MHLMDELAICTEQECDWCNKKFKLLERNMLFDSFGDWVLTRCDECTEEHKKQD